MEFNLVEIVALMLFLIGVFGLMWNRNIIKSIICVSMIDVAIVLFFLGINYQKGNNPPIGETQNVADPVVQAIMITTIIIGIAVTAVALMMFNALYHRYGATDWLTAIQARSKEIK